MHDYISKAAVSSHNSIYVLIKKEMCYLWYT